MAGINSDVYDIFHPTPVSLKELSAIAVSLEVWRCRMNELRHEGKLKEFNLFQENTDILMKTMLPDLPSMIYAAIEKYMRRFRSLFKNWIKEHYARIFHLYYDHRNSVLEYFEDFVCDYNGIIHYTKTAERMMRCDRFDVNQKFVIACTYFFEDDIRRIWPLVSSNMDLNNIDFSKSPQLYYWICCLRNEWHKIPSTEFNDTVEKMMFNVFMPHNRPSVEYFWNRLPPENRLIKAVDIFQQDVVSFVRFILPKLDDQQLNEFVNERCYGLMRSISKKAQHDEELILSTWFYIKNVINVDVFVGLVRRMLLSEVSDGIHPRHWFELCCRIWNSAAENWNRSAVTNITSINNNRFGEDLRGSGFSTPPNRKELTFLSSFLSYANTEERRRFWFNSWNDLSIHIHFKDLPKIMKLCFENEDEIIPFKEHVMANSGRIHDYCMLSLAFMSSFDALNDCASFLFSEVQAARNFKQQVLQRNLIDRDDVFMFNLGISVNVQHFIQFIDDAYANADLSANFKNQLMSLPSTQIRLSRNALDAHVPSEDLIKFIDAFVLPEDTLRQIKARIIDVLKEKAAVDESVVSRDSFTSLLSWCLGSDEEVGKFKMNYS